jgi:hypothetical protein
MADTGQVGLQIATDGNTSTNLRLTNDAALVVTEEYGKYFEMARRSQVYCAITTTSVAMWGIGSSTTYPILWNPVQYNKLVVPLFLNINPIFTLATAANYPSGGFCIGAVTNSVAGINSTYLSTLTTNAPTSTIIGRTPACSSQWSATAGVGTTGVVTRFYDLGLIGYAGNMASLSANATAANFNYDFHGALILAPGAAIAFAQNATAPVTVTYHISLLFAELPLPAGF